MRQRQRKSLGRTGKEGPEVHDRGDTTKLDMQECQMRQNRKRVLKKRKWDKETKIHMLLRLKKDTVGQERQHMRNCM